MRATARVAQAAPTTHRRWATRTARSRPSSGRSWRASSRLAVTRARAARGEARPPWSLRRPPSPRSAWLRRRSACSRWRSAAAAPRRGSRPAQRLARLRAALGRASIGALGCTGERGSLPPRPAWPHRESACLRCVHRGSDVSPQQLPGSWAGWVGRAVLEEG